MIGVIIQPSYIPWRGYFDLIGQADVFMFYDDVQYDKHGWRNRNRIRGANGPEWLTIPVRSAGNTSRSLPINSIDVDWSTEWNRRHLAKLKTAYGYAPFFKRYFPLIEARLIERKSRLVDYTMPLTIDIAGALGITGTRFVLSSEIDVQFDGDPTERLIRNLQHLGVSEYISGPTAKAYLQPQRFASANIALTFAEYAYPQYDLRANASEPALSILDLLFLHGPKAGDFIWSTSRLTKPQE